jgi:serine protease Do
MKRIVITMTAIVLFSLPFSGKAQDEKTTKVEKEVRVEKQSKGEKKEIEEIVIRKDDGTEMNLKVEINGDKITVNGTPLVDFKDDQVTIKKRKMIIKDGDGMMEFNLGPDAMAFSEDFRRQFEGGKEVIKPFLGVTTEKVTAGAKITEVSKESAAEKAGLKKDDIITKVGEDIIKDGEGLSKIIGSKKPKEVVKVTYLRNGKQGSVKATLGERKVQQQMELAFRGPRPKVRAFALPDMPGDHDLDMIYEDGFPDFQTFPRQKRLGIKIQDTEEGGNVKVIDVEEGSAAEKAGLKKDDIISEIGGVKIENTDDARKQLMPSDTKTAYNIKAKRGGKDMNFEVKFPKKLKTANL